MQKWVSVSIIDRLGQKFVPTSKWVRVGTRERQDSVRDWSDDSIQRQPMYARSFVPRNNNSWGTYPLLVFRASRNTRVHGAPDDRSLMGFSFRAPTPVGMSW